jgi:hypothetical protein
VYPLEMWSLLAGHELCCRMIRRLVAVAVAVAVADLLVALGYQHLSRSIQQNSSQTYIMLQQKAKSKEVFQPYVIQQNDFQQKLNGFASWQVLSL